MPLLDRSGAGRFGTLNLMGRCGRGRWEGLSYYLYLQIFLWLILLLSLQYHEVLLLSQCYCVVDSTIVPPSINVRFVTINVCVAVRSFVLIVSDIAIIRFDSANPPGYFRKVFASCLFLTSQRQGRYPWVPPRLQRLSQSTSCRSNSVTHHHSLEIEDCVLFWLPRGNFICSSCDSAEV